MQRHSCFAPGCTALAAAILVVACGDASGGGGADRDDVIEVDSDVAQDAPGDDSADAADASELEDIDAHVDTVDAQTDVDDGDAALDTADADSADAPADTDAAPDAVDATDGDAPDAPTDAGVTAPCEVFRPGRTIGTRICEPGAQSGYTLFAPIADLPTYLIDMDGRLVHQWEHTDQVALSTYLLEDGRLLRSTTSETASFGTNGQAGAVELVAWDGTVEWRYEYSDDTVRSHHDVEALPNGNIVLIAWERIDEATVLAAGREQPLAAGELWSEQLVEVRPEPDGSGTIVWQWRAWDHIIQSNDPTLPNFGEPADHPGRVDVDFGATRNADWLHANSVAYDAEHDQLFLTVHAASEVWVIDHDTTTVEAAGPAGDLLYRWGNPAVWNNGTEGDRRLFLPHDAHLIPEGLPGAGNLLVFNNGDMRLRTYSSVDELVLPRAEDGTFERSADGSFGPESAVWTYEDPDAFDSDNISGAQRLSGGTTLVCEGLTGRLFEVTPSGAIVWEYQLPVDRAGPLPQGTITGSSPVFRAYRYGAAYPGLAGRDLTPGDLLELPE